MVYLLKVAIFLVFWLIQLPVGTNEYSLRFEKGEYILTHNLSEVLGGNMVETGDGDYIIELLFGFVEICQIFDLPRNFLVWFLVLCSVDSGFVNQSM